jgi:hypothetical protein
MSYIEDLNDKIKAEIARNRTPVDDIMQNLIDQYGFYFRNTEIDSHDFPVNGFAYETKSETLSTNEFLREIKIVNRKAKDLGLEVYFSWVEVVGVSGKYGVTFDDFQKLYSGKRYLDRGRFKKITMEIRTIYV